jgi:hypothetical protein
MLSFLFSRRSEARNNRRHGARKSSRRVKSLRLGFEPLESRQLLSVTPQLGVELLTPPTPPTITTFNFNIPAEVANLGVQVGVYGQAGLDPGSPSIYLDPVLGFTSVSYLVQHNKKTMPLITLAPAGIEKATPKQLTLQYPGSIGSGEIFIFVGNVTTGLLVNANATIAAAKAAASPNTYQPGDNFAQIEFSYTAAQSSPTPTVASLDIDTSAIDSSGFPFTVVYPASSNLPFPLSTLGITVDETHLNANFKADFSEGGLYASYPEFAQCATYAQQQNTQDLQVVAPQDILAAESNPPSATSAVATADPNSTLAPNCNYYYMLTAFSNNVIDNSGGVLGETLPSTVKNVTAQSMLAGTSVVLSWTQYYDPNTVGYNIYRYSSTDGTPPTNTTAYNLIATVYGATTTTYTDEGAIPQAKQISTATATGYGFNPLSEYYTSEIQKFFGDYTAPNSFSLNRDGVLWVGNTVTYTPTAEWNTAGAAYTVLQLTAKTSNPAKGVYEGNVINVYEPIFSTNTSYVDADAPLPPAPNWVLSATESPAQMVFGCESVFNSEKLDPDVLGNTSLAGVLSDVENSIVSALNRGVATNDNFAPDVWAVFPQMSGTPTVATDSTSQIPAGTYYYAVTAVDTALGSANESTASLELSATVAGGQNVTLNWTPSTNAVSGVTYTYNIYRGTSAEQLFLLGSTSSLSYTDRLPNTQATALGPQYFALGSTSNMYAAVVQSNSTIDPVNGVSINGMAYGFPYSDDGGMSTNVNFSGDYIPNTVTVNLGSYSGLTFLTQSLPDAVVGTPYQQTFAVGGSGTGTSYVIKSGTLPSGFQLNPDTGVLSGTATSSQVGAYSFNVEAHNDQGKVVMPFSFNIDLNPPTTAKHSSNATASTTVDAAPSQVSSGGVLTASSAINIETTTLAPTAPQTTYTQTISATGGQGTLSFAVVNGSLPPGLSLSTPTESASVWTVSFDGKVTLGTPGHDYQFELRVSDASGDVAYQGYHLTVVGPTASTQSLAKNATTLLISGYGFDPIPGNNEVELYLGGSKTPISPSPTVTAASATQLTVTLGAPLSTTGALSAIVTVDSSLPSAEIQVANVIADVYPSITPSSDYLDTYATTLVINGANFDTGTNGTNDVALFYGAVPCDIVQSVKVNLATQLTVTLAGPLTVGATLNAQVTTDGVSTPARPVATISASIPTPAIDSSQNELYNNATALTILGSGFQPFVGATASVSLTSALGQPANIGTPIVVSDHQIVISSVDFTGCYGLLTATVTINSIASTPTIIADLDAKAAPIIITPSKLPDFWTNGTTLFLNGYGFTHGGASAPAVILNAIYGGFPAWQLSNFTVSCDSPNQIRLDNLQLTPNIPDVAITNQGVGYTSAPTVTFVGDATVPATATATVSNGKVTGITITSLGSGYTQNPQVVFTGGGSYTTEAVAFATLADLVNLTAQVIDPVNKGSNAPAVAKVQAATSDNAPTISEMTTKVSGNITTLTITGTNFDPAGTNYVTLYTNGGATALPVGAIKSLTGYSGIQDVVSDASGETLTVALAGPLPLGAIYATVITDGVISLPGTPVQICDVSTLGPVPDQPTTLPSLSQSPATITIQGSGFDPTGTNTVTLYTGTGSSQTELPASQITSVVADSNSQLTVILNSEMPLPTGSLSVSVIAHGSSSGTPVPIANIVAPGPTIDYCAKNLAVVPPSATTPTTPTTLVITGDNLTGATSLTISTATETIVAITDFTVGAGGTSLTATLQSSVLKTTTGQLYATVTTSTATSDAVEVGVIVDVSALPAITPNTDRWAASATQLIINGTGFDATGGGTNSVVLASGTVLPCTAISSTQLVADLTGVTLTPGALNATVITDGLTSDQTQVATIVNVAAPTVAATTSNYVPANATSFSITGSNFDINSGASITVTLSSGTVLPCTVVSQTQLTVNLDPGVKEMTAGEITAVVTIDGLSAPAVQVATAVNVPVITYNASAWYAGSPTLTINGDHFSPIPTNNVVSLSNGGAGQVISATSKQLVVQVTTVPSVGPLSAQVTVDSTVVSDSQVVATVYPGVNLNTASVYQTATGMTIYGAGFSTVGTNDQVMLYSGATQLGFARVTAPGLTTLGIQFVKKPSFGPLSAVVYVNGQPSQRVQVATITGPVSTATSTLTVSSTTLTAPGSVVITMQAKDANGYKITSGGLKVTFALAAGSAGGKLSAVTYNQNGTYTATFTSSTMGGDTITAKINGAALTAKAGVNVIFQSNFTVPGTLGAPWLQQKGTFTVSSGVAWAGSSNNNIAIYNATSQANVLAAANVFNVANGSFAALVARYTQNSGFYRAGIQNVNGQLFAVIEKDYLNQAGKIIGTTTLVKKAVSALGAGRLVFKTVGNKLQLSLNGAVVAAVTDSTFRTGSVGISGSPATGLGSFVATVSS